MQRAFPKPASAAQRALDKYLRTVEDMLFESLQYQQTLQNKKLGLFSISLEQLANRGGQIGPKKTRVHSWLKANNLEILQTVVLGSKFTGKVSEVKLSSLATLTDTLDLDENVISSNLSDAELDQYLSGEQAQNWALFELLYPDYQHTWSETKTLRIFDPLPVDRVSLKAYIEWLINSATKISRLKQDLYLRQALIILRIAEINDGIFLQRKNPSVFGRTYYEGLSVQNINKELRRAVLGNCWEYDIRSSVVAWKMNFASEYLSENNIAQSVDKAFTATLCYLEDKKDFLATIRHYTFSENTNVPKDLQLPLIKQALTALSFGARLTTSGWVDNTGSWVNPAISSIFKNSDDRARFMADITVKAFISEQHKLDTYIYDCVKKFGSHLLQRSYLQTDSGRPSKSKVLAFLYQHGETEVMNAVCARAIQSERIPIARVHDAIFFKKRLGQDLKYEVEQEMKNQTGNPYWHLSATELKRFEPISRDDIKEEVAHKKRISELEAIARALYHQG
jgi:hypothetical protein